MYKYLSEIKNRVFLFVINGLSTIITAYFYKENLLFSITYYSILKLKDNQLETFYFIFTSVTEILSVYISTAFFLSYQIMFIYGVYHSFIFLIPAFFNTEYLNFKFTFKIVLLFYFKSVVFFNYVLLPITFNFFLSFKKVTINNSFCLYFEAKILEYLEFFIILYCNSLLYFQIFALIFLLYNYFATPTIIKKFRKLFYYFFLILIFFIYSMELFVQITLILIFILIYECIILFFILKYTYLCYRQRK